MMLDAACDRAECRRNQEITHSLGNGVGDLFAIPIQCLGKRVVREWMIVLDKHHYTHLMSRVVHRAPLPLCLPLAIFESRLRYSPYASIIAQVTLRLEAYRIYLQLTQKSDPRACNKARPGQ